MAAIVKIKTNILKLKTGIALLVFSFCFLPSYAQPIVAHGYEFTYGEDSTLWIDIDSSSVYYESFLHNANAESFPLPFDFTVYNRTFSDFNVFRNGTVLFGDQRYLLSDNFLSFPFDRDVYGIWGLGGSRQVQDWRTWCSPPDSLGNRTYVLQITTQNLPPATATSNCDSLIWQLQLHEGDNSVVLAYRKTSDAFPIRYTGTVGMQMGHNRFIAVSPAYTPIFDTVWTTIQDSIVYSGWPGNNSYYRFVPVDTVCLLPAVLGVRGSWQSPSTVELVWHRCDRHDTYTVEYGYEGFTPGMGTVVSTTDTTVTLTGLCEGQNYDAYVRADCPDSLLSTGTLVQFQSPCVPSSENRIPFYDLTASGVACYTGTTSAPSSTVGIVDSGSLSPYSRHTVHTNPLERDPYTNNQLYTIPAGHCLSVRLGNWRIWSEQESITYTLHVDTNDYDLLVLRYALVQEYNVHPVQYNPQFEFDITDVQGNRISDCYHGLFFMLSDYYSGWNHGLDVVDWRDWEAVGVDLTPLHGQTIRVTLSNRDCTELGHFGYGYFTLESAHKHFRSTSCGEMTENTFHAPEGFSYRWYCAADTSVTLSTADSLHVSDTGLYYCRVSHQLSGYACNFTMSTYAGSRYPAAAFSHESTDSCGTLVRFLNHSVIARDSSHTNLTSYPCEQYLWDFGDGTTSTEINPVHQFTADTLHIVTLYAMLADGACVDSVSDTFYLNLPRDTIFDTVCAGQTYFFHGERIRQPGRWTYLDSCSGHVLYLHHWPKYDIQIYDTITIGETYTFNGKTFSRPVLYTVQHTSVNGCDSVVTLHLSSREERSRTVCETALPFMWEGRTFAAAGTDTMHVVSQAGTDSIVIHHLSVRRQPVLQVTPEPICTERQGYLLPLCDTLCYTVVSAPPDSLLPPAAMQGGTEFDTLLLQPATTTEYWFTADYCDSVSCPVTDTFLLEPIRPVQARVAVEPSYLTETVRDLTAVDLSLNNTERQWFVNSVLLADSDSVLHYRAGEEWDSVRIMLVANNDFCTDTAWIAVPSRIQNLWFPNVFTPDEPTNNLFRGYGTRVKNYELSIYTRWGDCIFRTKDINEGWDGTYLGVRSPVSAYLYVCNYSTMEGEPRTVYGTVTLLR